MLVWKLTSSCNAYKIGLSVKIIGTICSVYVFFLNFAIITMYNHFKQKYYNYDDN